VALAIDGTPLDLAGSDRGTVLAEGSPLLDVLAGQVPTDGHERRFLWPDGRNGWSRVRIVPCVDEASGRSLSLVTVRPDAQVRGLTRREIEVLTLLAGGASNPAIASVLHVSHRTVATHVEHILEKLDVSTRAAAAGRAVREALVLPVVS
jgi:DNA-binding CsgD family transcriptional regulator